MLRIDEYGYNPPDSTYFRTGAAQPELEQDEYGQQVLKLVNGTGTFRSWGAPRVTSRVVLADDDLIAIHVGFTHKHRGGQFWRYYRPDEDGVWHEQKWKPLPDETKERILAAYQTHAPDWAKVPGKLSKEYGRANFQVQTSYKLVELTDDGRLVNLRDGQTEYILGKRLAERAISEHRGGYYSYPDLDSIWELFTSRKMFGKTSSVYTRDMTLALLRCEISGHIEYYGNGKWASTYIRPLEVLNYYSYTPEQVAS